MAIIIKTPPQITNIRESGKYLTELLSLLKTYCRPGINLLEIEQQASYYIMSHNLKGCFKGYQGYPTNTCLSVNDGLVHCIPKDYTLVPGDVIKVDTGIDFHGGISDAAISVVVGGDHTNPEGAKLIHTTKKSLDESIIYLQVGNNLMQYAQSVYSIVKDAHCEVIKDLCGHGVGVKVHEDPHVCNRPHKSMKNTTLKANMILALEPITALHSSQCVQKGSRDIVTKGGDLGGQREYTVLISPDGPEILAGLQDY